MSKASGDAQSAPAGVPLATRPTVLIADQFGNGVAGVAATFAVTSGGGSISGATVATDANGLATIGGWTLGTVAGVNTATATAPGLSGNPATFTETGVAGPVATITKVAGDNLSALVATLLGTAPSVKIADQFGNVVANQAVTFAVASGGGSIAGATPTSGPTGIATVGSWTLGATPGANTLTASSGSAQPVTFTATGTAAVTLPNVAGTWSGNWVDTRYGVSGALTNVVLTQTSTTFSGTGTIDLSSLGLGVQSGTATGTISGNTITFTFALAGIGAGSGTLTGTSGSGSGGVTALNFGNFTYTGTVSSTSIAGTFQFTSPTGGNGTMTLTKH
jgi:adhesin/invasin